MRKLSGHEIALSALSSALATLFLLMGVYSNLLLFTGYLFACISLMLPLARKSYIGFVLAYGASCLLSLIFGIARFIDLLPFILFFGLHPLVNEIQLKYKINKWIAFAVKALWFDGTMYLIWRFVFEMTTTISFVDTYIIPIILVGGTVFFVLYDYIMYKWRFVINRLVDRIMNHK